MRLSSRFALIDAEEVEHVGLDQPRLRGERCIALRRIEAHDRAIDVSETRFFDCVRAVIRVGCRGPGVERLELDSKLRVIRFDIEAANTQMHMTGRVRILRARQRRGDARTARRAERDDFETRTAEIVLHLVCSAAADGEFYSDVRHLLIDERDDDGGSVYRNFALREIDVCLARERDFLVEHHRTIGNGTLRRTARKQTRPEGRQFETSMHLFV